MRNPRVGDGDVVPKAPEGRKDPRSLGCHPAAGPSQIKRHLPAPDLIFSPRFNNYATTNTTFEIQALVAFVVLLRALQPLNRRGTAGQAGAGAGTLPVGAVAMGDILGVTPSC